MPEVEALIVRQFLRTDATDSVFEQGFCTYAALRKSRPAIEVFRALDEAESG
jgi:hypothetical protein